MPKNSKQIPSTCTISKNANPREKKLLLGRSSRLSHATLASRAQVVASSASPSDVHATIIKWSKGVECAFTTNRVHWLLTRPHAACWIHESVGGSRRSFDGSIVVFASSSRAARSTGQGESRRATETVLCPQHPCFLSTPVSHHRHLDTSLVLPFSLLQRARAILVSPRPLPLSPVPDSLELWSINGVGRNFEF